MLSAFGLRAKRLRFTYPPMQRAALILALVMLAGCRTSNVDQWSGGGGTPFKQAERTCLDLMDSIREEDGRSDFFLGCMNAYGWTPRPGAMLDF